MNNPRTLALFFLLSCALSSTTCCAFFVRSGYLFGKDHADKLVVDKGCIAILEIASPEFSVPDGQYGQMAARLEILVNNKKQSPGAGLYSYPENTTITHSPNASYDYLYVPPLRYVILRPESAYIDKIDKLYQEILRIRAEDNKAMITQLSQVDAIAHMREQVRSEIRKEIEAEWVEKLKALEARIHALEVRPKN